MSSRECGHHTSSFRAPSASGVRSAPSVRYRTEPCKHEVRKQASLRTFCPAVWSRIRHFGLFANRKRSATLARCCLLIGIAIATDPPVNPELRCPICNCQTLFAKPRSSAPRQFRLETNVYRYLSCLCRASKLDKPVALYADEEAGSGGVRFRPHFRSCIPTGILRPEHAPDGRCARQKPDRGFEDLTARGKKHDLDDSDGNGAGPRRVHQPPVCF